MKILLDENLPHDLRLLIAGHEVFTVSFMGWKGMKNGALLRIAAENRFDALVTNDSHIESQQNLATLPIAVIVLGAATNTMDDLRLKLPALERALSSVPPLKVIRLE